MVTHHLTNTLSRLLITCALGAPLLEGCAASPSAVAAEDAALLEDLSGTYEDPAPYDYGGAFGKRTFTFAEGRWTLRFVLGLDPALASPVFAFRTHGTYDVLGPSPAVPGAYEALFREEAKYVTLLTPSAELAQGFGLAGCGLTPDVEKDVSAEGCAGWKPVAVCGEDHDLLALTPGGGVRFGVRPRDNDMCTADKRPTALTPPVMPRR